MIRHGQMIIGLEKPSYLYIRKNIGTISQSMAEDLKNSSDPALFVKMHLQDKLVGLDTLEWVKMVYYEEYTILLKRYQYNQNILSLPVNKMLQLFQRNQEDIRDEFYAGPMDRCTLALRAYLVSQDVYDLSAVPTEEMEKFMSKLDWMEKVGDFWVPKTSYKRRTLQSTSTDVIRDPYPSFSLYRMCVYRRKAVFPEKVTILEKLDQEMIRIPIHTHFLTNAMIKLIRESPLNKVCFITNSKTELKKATQLEHFIYSNVTIAEGYALCISRVVAKKSLIYFIV